MKWSIIQSEIPELPPYAMDFEDEALRERYILVRFSSEDRHTVAELVFSPSVTKQYTAVLRDIRISEDFIGDPVAMNNVMRLTNSICVKAGARQVLWRMIRTADDQIDPVERLIREHFSEEPMLDRHLCFLMEDLHDGHFIARVMPQMAVDPNIVPMRELREVERIDSVIKLGIREEVIDRVLLESELSLMYMIQGKVLGAVLAERIHGGDIYVHGLYPAAGLSPKQLFLPLMVGMFSRASAGENLEQKYMIRLTNPRFEALFLNILGSGTIAPRIRQFRANLR